MCFFLFYEFLFSVENILMILENAGGYNKLLLPAVRKKKWLQFPY